MLANNMAIVFHEEKKYEKAAAIYKNIIDSLGSNSEFYPKLLLNYSRSKWFSDEKYSPVKNYLLAEKLSQKNKDEWTIDAAYAYLAGYYLKKNKDSANYYSQKMLLISKKLNYPNDQLEALQNLIKVNNGKVSQNYFENYQRIRDSVTNSQNKAKNQFALIRYESEKNKSENLILQKQKSENEFKIVLQNVVIFAIIIIAFLVGLFTFYRNKKRKQKLILESQNKLQEQRLDFSKKIHDVVANGIYEVMTTIENQKDLPKEKILDKLELMYEKSRNLSYNNPENQQDFNERLSGLISSFDAEKSKIIIIGNEPGFWNHFDKETKEELFQIIQELLVNMKKHSHASQTLLRFGHENTVYKIVYSDNGVGLPDDFVPRNGLSNLTNRVKSISGSVDFERRTPNGLKLTINL